MRKPSSLDPGIPSGRYLRGMLLLARCVVLVLTAGSAVVAADSRLEPEVGEPGLEERMGGCSMRCTFAGTVGVSQGNSATTTKALNDEKATSAWIGVQAADLPTFRFAFPKRLPREMEAQVPFYGIDVINGHWASEEQWQQHARIRRARLL